MSSHSLYRKPLPRLRPETQEFWRAAQRHELLLQCCESCGQRIFFPRIVCHRCLSPDLKWIKASGKGTVYSFTIVRQVRQESFKPDTPYIYAIIELDEGVRMISNVTQIDPHRVFIGMRVRVVFDDVTPEFTLPKFAPDARPAVSVQPPNTDGTKN